MVKSFLESIGRVTPFIDNYPGRLDNFIFSFEKRNKKLPTRRNLELITKARAEGLSHTALNLFFKMYTLNTYYQDG